LYNELRIVTQGESMYQAPPPYVRPWSKARAIIVGLIIYAIGAVLIRFVIKLLQHNSLLLGLSIFVLLSLMNLSIVRIVQTYKRSQKNNFELDR